MEQYRTHLRPTGQKAIVEMIEPESISMSGLHIPDHAQPTATHGIILRMGQPHEDLQEGVRVIINPHGGAPMKIGGRNCKMVEYNEILGVLTPA